jgi:hypothetical protein
MIFSARVECHFDGNDRDLKKSEATLRKMAIVSKNSKHSSIRISHIKIINQYEQRCRENQIKNGASPWKKQRKPEIF